MEIKILEKEGRLVCFSALTASKIVSIPVSYKGDNYEFFNNWLAKKDFKKLLQTRLKQIKKKEPLVFELVAKKEVLGARIVNTRDGIRFELCFESGKIKVNELLYSVCENKLPEVYLNY